MTNNDNQRVTLFLDPRLLKIAKAQAIVEDVSLTVLAEKAFIKYLPKRLQLARPTLKKKDGEII